MRTVESRLIRAFLSLNEASPSPHDRIEVNAAGVRALLYGTCYCSYRFSTQSLTLGVPGGRWQTATTKSRINAFAHHFSVPGLYQESFHFYWSDGEPYTGTKTYSPITL